MEGSHEQAQRIVSSILLGIRAEHRDRAAHSIVLQNELEPLSRIHPFLKGELNRRAQQGLALRVYPNPAERTFPAPRLPVWCCRARGSTSTLEEYLRRPGTIHRLRLPPGRSHPDRTAERLLVSQRRWAERPAAGPVPTAFSSGAHRRAAGILSPVGSARQGVQRPRRYCRRSARPGRPTKCRSRGMSCPLDSRHQSSTLWLP